eukprot:scaffold676979_cov60-Prasinocladus_malaysianus.AAC.1
MHAALKCHAMTSDHYPHTIDSRQSIARREARHSHSSRYSYGSTRSRSSQHSRPVAASDLAAAKLWRLANLVRVAVGQLVRLPYREQFCPGSSVIGAVDLRLNWPSLQFNCYRGPFSMLHSLRNTIVMKLISF